MIPFHGSQYPGRGGHYESWFLRGNHPRDARAFWIRYTLFVPADGTRKQLGELWAIYFDGRAERVVASKQEYDIQSCHFDKNGMNINIGPAHLESGRAEGSAQSEHHRIDWQLEYDDGDPSLLLLPEAFYKAPFPKAKSVVSRPHVQFHGNLTVDGETIDVTGWHGSENHNWGSEHTHQYAWGQVMGFDNAPEAMLECATARVKVGPVPTPRLTIACLRLEDREYRFNRMTTALTSRGHYRFFRWSFATRKGNTHLRVAIEADPAAFTGLTYYNPPGGNKTCLNTKIARCRAVLTDGGEQWELVSRNGAAFEILTDREDHGIDIAV